VSITITMLLSVRLQPVSIWPIISDIPLTHAAEPRVAPRSLPVLLRAAAR
jgi:hypothetical protein